MNRPQTPRQRTLVLPSKKKPTFLLPLLSTYLHEKIPFFNTSHTIAQKHQRLFTAAHINKHATNTNTKVHKTIISASIALQRAPRKGFLKFKGEIDRLITSQSDFWFSSFPFGRDTETGFVFWDLDLGLGIGIVFRVSCV